MTNREQIEKILKDFSTADYLYSEENEAEPDISEYSHAILSLISTETKKGESWRLGYQQGIEEMKATISTEREEAKKEAINDLMESKIELINELPYELVAGYWDSIEWVDREKVLKILESYKESVDDLAYCKKCIQMTNHLEGVCQKCKDKESV